MQTNWKAVIGDLKSHGLTQAQIAEAVGVTQSAINLLNIGSTKEPRHSVGVRLLELRDDVRTRGTKRQA